jgi:hypothetical protein
MSALTCEYRVARKWVVAWLDSQASTFPLSVTAEKRPTGKVASEGIARSQQTRRELLPGESQVSEAKMALLISTHLVSGRQAWTCRDQLKKPIQPWIAHGLDKSTARMFIRVYRAHIYPRSRQVCQDFY